MKLILTDLLEFRSDTNIFPYSAQGWCALHFLAVWGDWCATVAGWFAGARSWPGLWFQCLVMSFLGSSQVHKAHLKCTQIQQPNPFNYFQPMILASRCHNLSLHKTPMWQTHINLYANPTIYPLRDCHQWVAKMIRKWYRFSRNSIGQVLPCRGCCWRCMPKKIPCHYLVMAMHP